MYIGVVPLVCWKRTCLGPETVHATAGLRRYTESLASGGTTPKLVGDDSAVKIENMDLGNGYVLPGEFCGGENGVLFCEQRRLEVPRTPKELASTKRVTL